MFNCDDNLTKGDLEAFLLGKAGKQISSVDDVSRSQLTRSSNEAKPMNAGNSR